MVHGDNFTYEKTEYKNCRTKVTVTNKYWEDLDVWPLDFLKKSKDKKFSPINAIASIVGKSDEGYIEGFKVKTGFEDFAAKYKDIRNHQMHDFFSGMVSESNSRGAIECGAKLVCSVAKEVMRKATDEASIGQLSRLIEATNKCLRY